MSRIVNPSMITLARESRGLTQGQLAKRVQVTQGKISKYEAGLLAVSSADLMKLATALDYSSEIFYQADEVYGLGSSFLFHRQRRRVPISVQKKVQARINIMRMQADRLLKGAEIAAEREFVSLDIDEHGGSPERVARSLRARWRVPLGPISNLTALTESAGGLIFQTPFETPLIDAAHLWLPGLPPMFFMNSDVAGERYRFNLAHELGHAIMHENATGDREDEAHRFAAEFLMPREEIANHLEGLTLEKAARLKAYWKVSMQAIVRHALRLKRISERQYRSLFTRLSARGYRKVEPIPIPMEQPKAPRKLVAVFREFHGYSESELRDLLFDLGAELLEPQSTTASIRTIRLVQD